MKVGGQILWNVTPICETSQIYYLMGRRPMRGVFGNHLKDQSFHLVHWWSITLFLQRTSPESINLERKSYLDCSSDTHCTRRGIWKGDVLVADLEELETMDASEIYSKRLNAKEVIFPKEKGEFIFPIADGRIKTLGGDQDLRTSTVVRHRPMQGEGHVDLLGESEGSLPPPHDSFPDAGEAINDFWSMSGNFIYRHHVELRVKLYSPREESFPTPLKYMTYPELRIRIWMSSKRNASMITGISMDRETCQILGQVSHNLLYWKKNLQTDMCGPGRD